MTEELKIASRYKKFGVNESLVQSIVQSGLAYGLTRKAALIGARMCLGELYKQHEYFIVEDVSEVTGESVEDVNRITDEHCDELMQMGGMVEVRTTPWLT
jgi:hypothetical protein